MFMHCNILVVRNSNKIRSRNAVAPVSIPYLIDMYV